MRTATVRTFETIISDCPVGERLVAPAGTYPAEVNRHGAVSIRLPGAKLLGVKPGEFEFVSSHSGRFCAGM